LLRSWPRRFDRVGTGVTLLPVRSIRLSTAAGLGVLSAACQSGAPATGATNEIHDAPEAGAEAGVRDATAPPGSADAFATDSSLDAGLPDSPAEGGTLDAGETRDARAWPFSATSIWNTPIGSAAVYVPAQITKSTGSGMTADEDIIILHPEAPTTDVLTNTADWNDTENRCPGSSPTLLSVPIPSTWTFTPVLPDTPNASAAILLSDGRTIKQTQPLSRCTDGGPATSHYLFPDNDIMGDGTTGAHGGSGLSAIGGTLRLGELRPGGGHVRHALKIELWKAENYFTCATGAACQFRWPATSGETNTAGTNVSAMREGSLLALPATLDLTALGLETAPALSLAWTLQNYGGYIVDDTAWSVYALAVETGPDGRFLDQFQQDYGFTFTPSSKDTPWGRDMDRLFLALAVVDDNGPSSVGGGGVPRQPLAPPFGP
jgi:hypothetical protein